MKDSPRNVRVALLAAAICHGSFGLAVTSMAFQLATGMQHGVGRLHGLAAALANGLLLVQFPLLHSWLLSPRGRRVLARCWPRAFGGVLQTTTYSTLAASQLLLTFWAWSPSGTVWLHPSGVLGAAHWAMFGSAWLFLVRALHDAGLPLQTGAAGWWALLRGRPVEYGDMPTAGMFSRCRQPIYLGFAMILWTTPCWSLDGLCLAVVWTVYCVVGPRFKEARFLSRYGERFLAYQQAVPYLLPRVRR